MPLVKTLVQLGIGLAAIAVVGCATQRSEIAQAPTAVSTDVVLVSSTVQSMTPAPAPTTATPTSLAPWLRLPQQVIDGRPFRHYARVNRTDGTYRMMFIDEATLRAWTAGQSLPEGALFVMETYYTPGVESTNFIKALGTDSHFTYGSFSPSRPLFTTRADNSCTSCHNGSVDPIGTYTLPMLEVAVAQGLVMETTCDQAGRSPCGPETYASATPLAQTLPVE